MSRKLIVIVLGLVLIPTAFCAGKYKKMRYGMGGCGLFSMFIKDNTMLPQIGKVVADYYFGSASTNTSAMTTGTSNCTDDPSGMALREEQQVFLMANYNSLIKESAQGTGTHLQAFAEVLGCDKDEFGRFSRENHSRIYVDDNPETALENYRTLIQQDTVLSSSCNRV